MRVRRQLLDEHRQRLLRRLSVLPLDLGYSGVPSDASPATQDEAAMKLAQRSGFGQWPLCGRGMGADQLAGPVAAPAQASRSADRPSVVAQPAAVQQTYFTTALVNQVRDDVRQWQARMNELGYHIQTDGRYGPQSAAAARQLQAAKGLVVDGIVGPRTWRATFG
jgi:hypothetical protein